MACFFIASDGTTRIGTISNNRHYTHDLPLGMHAVSEDVAGRLYELYMFDRMNMCCNDIECESERIICFIEWVRTLRSIADCSCGWYKYLVELVDSINDVLGTDRPYLLAAMFINEMLVEKIK